MDEVHRRFVLVRNVDVSGVSGTGVVAEGVRWTNGTASVCWRGEHPSIVAWPRGMTSVQFVHGHGGNSVVAWLDEETT